MNANQQAAGRVWRVSGLIAGRRMPTEPISLLGVQVRPLEAGPRWTQNFKFELGAEVADGMKATPIAALPPPLGFQAYHEFELEINAPDAPEAAAAGIEQLDRVVAAFALAGELHEPGPVTSIESVQPLDGEPAGEWQLAVRHANLVISEADGPFVEHLNAVEGLAAADAAFGKLLAIWAKAERFYLFAADIEGRRRALLAFAQVMEAVGKAVASDIKPNPDAEEEARAVVKNLLEQLLAKGDTESAKKVIREARLHLDRIDINTEGQRMRTAGEMIGMDGPARKRGQELWTLRSKKAGHDTSEAVSNEEMVFAREVADEYLRRYADWRLAKQGEAPEAKQ